MLKMFAILHTFAVLGYIAAFDFLFAAFSGNHILLDKDFSVPELVTKSFFYVLPVSLIATLAIYGIVTAFKKNFVLKRK